MDKELKLKERVCVNYFDDKNSYILKFNDQQWMIKEKMYKAIQCINTYGCYNKKVYEKEFTLDEFNSVIVFLKNNNMLEGYNSISLKKKQNKNAFMWLKMKIINGEKLYFLKKLDFLFNIFWLKVSGVFFLILLVLGIHNLINLYGNFSQLILENWMFLIVYFLVGTFIHELGHVTACLCAGICPKEVGFVMYIIYPSFYTDVSATWGASRENRLKIDMGGIHFQILYNCLGYIIAYIFNSKILITGCAIETMTILTVLNPFIKMDGYWFITDLLQVVNLHNKVKKYILMLKGNMKDKIEELIRDMNLDGWRQYVFYIYAILYVFYIMFLCFSILYMYVNAFGTFYLIVTQSFDKLLTFEGIVSVFYIIIITAMIIKTIGLYFVKEKP